MSNSSYIYANSRIAALEARLLSASQLERMISAKSADEAFLALNDTFLAPFVAGKSRADLAQILRKSVSVTKKRIVDMVPDAVVFDVLWLRYDFYNLKTIIKAQKVGLSTEDIHERCFYAGTVDVDAMIVAVDKESLSNIVPELDAAFREARDAEQVYEIDFAMNRGYFRVARRLAQESKIAFVGAYVTRMIDLYNLAAQLRLLSLGIDIDRASIFMDGGSFALADVQTREAILERYMRMGDEVMWREAIDAFEKTGDFAALEKASDDAMVAFVKSQHDVGFSAVPVFGHVLAHRNNTQIVKTVIAAKEAGMSETELRRLLRKLYS